MPTDRKRKPQPGEVIAGLRAAKGWTPYRLAKESGVPPQTVYRLESGARTPGLAVLGRLCAALGASLAVFDGADFGP